MAAIDTAFKPNMHSGSRIFSTVSKIINERGSITPDMALRLSRAFETSAELWLKLQTNYDLWNAASKSKEWETVKKLVSA